MASFISALSGLSANQRWIDVIGNNLANTNTPGFKSSRALFSDLLSVTVESPTAPTGALGGTNPLQIGLGVNFSYVDKNLAQGALNVTGRTFDVAMLGNGFFGVTNGVETLYTRVGAFGLDADGNMVDQRTGYRVLDNNGATFSIDTREIFPPQATSEVDMTGNLPAQITGPLAEILTSSAPFNEGTAATMIGTQAVGTGAGQSTIPSGETWTMELVVNGGAPEQISILGTGSQSAADIAAQITAQSDHVTATAVGDQIQLVSDKTGLQSTVVVNPGVTGFDLKGLAGFGDFVQGTEDTGSGATDLNDLATNLTDYDNGDTIQVAGTDVDGSPVFATFVYGTDGTTVGELVSFIDAQFASATASFNATTGQIELSADATGDAELSVTLLDDTSQAGLTDWAQHAFAVTTNGTGPDTVTTSTEVFDSSGTSHVLTQTFTRQDDGSWNLDVTVPDTEGTVLNGTISGITFNEDGSIQTPTTGNIDVQFGSLGSQTITIDLGEAGQFGGLTQFGNPSSVVSDFQDGYGAGELTNMNVDGDGNIEGFYTNGQSQTLGSFGIATFTNVQGLDDLGDNYLRESANSGARVLSQGNLAGAGEVVGGAIEGSNVDTAQEFVHLIQAQRGFQANARVVTVQDELLSEVVNIV